MIAVVQRVASATVEVDGREVARIDRGLLALVGITTTDTEADARWLAGKLPALRVFEDAAGKMNLALADLTADTAQPTPGLLLVPNFTLAGDAHKGRRPSFDGARRPESAQPLFDHLVQMIRQAPGLSVQTGVFRAHMRVTLLNDGPVTLILDSRRGSVAP
jgi:D-tyrosyl-tRNA(Tyr) deacylase